MHNIFGAYPVSDTSMSGVDVHSETPPSRHSVASDSQATHEYLTQTMSSQTTPQSSISKGNSTGRLLTNVNYHLKTQRPANCACDSEVAKIVDPQVGRAQLAKLEESHARFEIGPHEPRRETKTLIALRKHVNECLKVSSASSTISVHTANSTLRSWKANRSDKNSAVHVFCKQSEPSTFSANTLTTNNANYDREVNEALRLYATGLLSGHKTSSQHSLPQHMHRSLVYKATGEYVNDPVCRTGAPEESNSAEYLSSLGDLKSMREGFSKKTRVNELEHVIWDANDDPKVSNFARQASTASYQRILQKTLDRCTTKNHELIGEANKLFELKHTALSSQMLQQLAHLRVLMKDTSRQIRMCQKTISKPDLFLGSMTKAERSQLKRWPLSAPRLCRERYALQVRVIIEMLQITQELLEWVKQQQEEVDAKPKLYADISTNV